MNNVLQYGDYMMRYIHSHRADNFSIFLRVLMTMGNTPNLGNDVLKQFQFKKIKLISHNIFPFLQTSSPFQTSKSFSDFLKSKTQISPSDIFLKTISTSWVASSSSKIYRLGLSRKPQFCLNLENSCLIALSIFQMNRCHQ